MDQNKVFKPLILKDGDAQLQELLRDPTVVRVDDYDSQIQELKEIQKTHQLPESLSMEPTSAWVYYPWSQLLVRIVANPHFRLVRHSRNQNLMTYQEQQSVIGKRVGFAGLNVGNPAAICMVLESVMLEGKYADNDGLALSNLNRFRARLGDLGLNKAVLSARQSFELDPFLDLEVYDEGIAPGQEKDFLLNPKVDLLVEEMDNLQLKVSIREEARQARIPVVMVTGNGENVIIDVERYDQEPDLPILNGYLKKEVLDIIKSPALKELKGKERVLLARDFMGSRFLAKRLQESFLEVGKTLAGIPQLAESSFLRGAAVCYVAKRILTGSDMKSGRYFLEMDKITTTLGEYDAE